MAVRIEIETEPVSGGRVVLHLLFRLLPMLVMAGVLTAAATIVAFAIGISVVATGHVPRRLASFQVRAIRQRVRTFSGFFLLRADTPPWPAELDLCDPGDDPRSRSPWTFPRLWSGGRRYPIQRGLSLTCSFSYLSQWRSTSSIPSGSFLSHDAAGQPQPRSGSLLRSSGQPMYSLTPGS